MKEAIGQAFIVNLILFFFVILVLLFFGSINYSKAYKTKNRLITTIEKYGGYPADNNEREDATDELNEIKENLVKAGYQTVTKDVGLVGKCNNIAKKSGGTVLYPLDEDFSNNRNYEYCIIKKSSSIGSYYQVVAYMRFEIPLIGGMLNFPVMGETKVLYDNIGI